MPTRSQMIFLAIPSCRYAKISDLCSEVSCLYMINTKLINLGETSVSFFGMTGMSYIYGESPHGT